MSDHLGIYLNDHLAGSVVALELLKHLETMHAGKDLERNLFGLRVDILADRHELEALMDRLQVSVSNPRQAMAWFAEKMTEFKLRLDDAAGGKLHLFEALETIALGIDGKLAMWRALAAVAPAVPALAHMDYERLMNRAEEQRHRIETLRLGAARATLCPPQ